MKQLLRLTLLAMLLPLAANASVVWKGDFETGDLSQWTEAWLVASDRMQVQQDRVREGRNALKVTVKRGDDPVNASGNRNELFYASYEPNGSEYYYKWSTLFPQNFPSSPQWQVFTQWHHDGCCGSPPLEFYVISDEMHMRVGGSSGQVLWTAPVQRDQWNDFVLHVKWSPNPRVGFVELYHKGKLVVPRRHLATRYPNMSGYLQFGYYRDESISQTSSVYHDGFTMATTLEDVMPSPRDEAPPTEDTSPPYQAPTPEVPVNVGNAPQVSPGDDTPSYPLEPGNLPPGGCGASVSGGAPLLALGSLGLLAALRRRRTARRLVRGTHRLLPGQRSD